MNDKALAYIRTELIKVTWLCSAVITLILVYLLILIIKKRKNFKRLTQEWGYPMPEINDILHGHVNEHTSLKKQAEWYVRFGKIYGFYNCDRPHLRVADLETINEIFIKQSRNFVARTYREYRLTPFNDGILFSFDERWRRARRIFQQAMSIYRMTADDATSQANVDLLKGINILLDHFSTLTRPDGRHADNQREQTDQKSDRSTAVGGRQLPEYRQINELGYVPVHDSNSPTGYSIDIRAHGVMEVIALDIILRVGLDVYDMNVLNGVKEPMMKFIDSWLNAVDDPIAQLATAVPMVRILMPLVVSLNKSFRSYCSFMLNLFHVHNERWKQAEREAGGRSKLKQRRPSKIEPVSVFHSLVGEYRAKRMRKREVIAHAGATIVAGFETTATTASYILWNIGRYPELKARLLADIQKDGVQSRYLDMFIKEVMRMYPALANFVVRSPIEDTFVAGRPIKRGMSVYLGVNSVHYDESIYPDPYKFDPERFAEGKTYPPGAYVPFGLGHRMCVGYHLAMREMKLIVVEFLKAFDIELIAPQLELERESLTIFLTRSKNEIRVRLIPRCQQRRHSASDVEAINNSSMSQK